MELNRLNDWLQTLASIGVIIGLILVAYELRQEHNLTRAEMGSDTFSSIEELMRSYRNPATAAALAKAIERPTELTIEEHITLDGYFWEVFVTQFMREQYMQRRGIFGNELSDDDVDNAARNAANAIFSTDYGYAWWQLAREDLLPFQRESLDKFASGRQARPAIKKFRALEELLQKVESGPGSDRR